jgi:hypothetical protein
LRRQPRYPARWRVAFTLCTTIGGTFALILVPFALAGLTGNALWIAAPVFVTLVYVALRESPRCLAYYRSLWPRAWLTALVPALIALAITLAVGEAVSLLPANGVLDWSLGTLFHVGGDAGENGFAIPLTDPVLAVLYAPAAILALPLLAWWEEEIFRKGTAGLSSALRRGILFGLAHVTAGVSLGGCMALGCAGFIFTLVYWRAQRHGRATAARDTLPSWAARRLFPPAYGRAASEQFAVFRATQVHLMYNAVGVLTILLLAFGPWQSQ